MGTEVPGEPRLVESSLEQAPRLNSTDRPVVSASGLEYEPIGGAEPILLELVEPRRERRPGGGMQQHRAALALALHVPPGNMHALDNSTGLHDLATPEAQELGDPEPGADSAQEQASVPRHVATIKGGQDGVDLELGEGATATHGFLSARAP